MTQATGEWRDDPQDMDRLRWHDGHDFTDQTQSRTVAIAEEQLRLASRLASDVAQIKGLIVFVVVLSILAGIGAIYAVTQS